MKKIKFKKIFWGYNRGQVDRFIQRVIQEYNAGSAQNEELEAELHKLEALNNDTVKKLSEWEISNKGLLQKIDELQKETNMSEIAAQRQAVGQILIEAEIFAVNKTEAAKAEANQIVENARREADEIIEEASTQLLGTRTMRDKIVSTIEASLKSILPDQGEEVLAPEADANNMLDLQYYRVVSGE